MENLDSLKAIHLATKNLQKAALTIKRAEMFGHQNDFEKIRASLESIHDTSTALTAYLANKPTGNLNPDHYLRLYGALQAMYVQQDAILALASTMGLKVSFKDDAPIERARNLRNDVAGHPINRSRPGQSVKGHCAIIAGTIQADGFEYEIYFENGVTERTTVYLPESIAHQISFTLRWLTRFAAQLNKFMDAKISKGEFKAIKE